LDAVFIHPTNDQGIYQALATKYAAIEPPYWALLLAESCRSRGFNVRIIDCGAEQLNDDALLERVKNLAPRLICFVVYGQNVNSGTVAMSGASRSAHYIRQAIPGATMAALGSYPQALPIKMLTDEIAFDFAFTTEGVYALWAVLAAHSIDQDALSRIPGIVYRNRDGIVVMNAPGHLVPNDRMDTDLPGYAWDLLPYRSAPLDLYRSPMWHAGYDERNRSPYASILTSLGCLFGCSFCMINSINRNDQEPIGRASKYSKMRFWSPEHSFKQIQKLVDMGVTTIRIVDEMFLLNKNYYEPLLDLLANSHFAPDLRLWAYSRVDTIRNPEILNLLRRAGFRWLCLGIESGNLEVRLEVSKGKFENVNVRKVVDQIHQADIDIIANYIVGLPGETESTMEETQRLSEELCTSGWNMYTAMALPGSDLYADAIEEGLELPADYTGFSWHSFDSFPLATLELSRERIVAFRDEAFTRYHTNQKFLARIELRFGPVAVNNIKAMTTVKIRRKLLERSSQ